MKNKKMILVSAVLSTLLLSGTIVNANGAKDCKGSISMAATSATFKVFEGGTPMNPITPKKIDGIYYYHDVNNCKASTKIAYSVKKGQLSYTKYAAKHYKSTSAKMAYYANGVICGTVYKTYNK